MRIEITWKTVAVVAVLALALASAGCCSRGCMSACSACDGSPASNCTWGCPKIPGMCCGWDFYVPCDMIEGRAERECGAPCSQPYVAGQVVSRSYAVPVSRPCAAPNGPFVTTVNAPPAAPRVAPPPPQPLPEPAVVVPAAP